MPEEVGRQNKEVIDLKMLGGLGGFLVVPKYLANRRFDFDELIKKEALGNDKDVSVTEKTYGAEWGDYHVVAIRWGHAMYKYRLMAHNYKLIYEEKFEYSNYLQRNAGAKTRGAVDYVRDKTPLVPTRSEEELEKTKHYNLVADAYEDMLRRYAALQNADLYAHFSPVSLILHKKFISDFPRDPLGNESIWGRVKLAGSGQYYQVTYDEEGTGVTPDDDTQREIVNQYVKDDRNAAKHTPTSITRAPYFDAILDAFVSGNPDAEKTLYEETKDKN